METRYYVYLCSSTARDITLAVLYGYKAIIQAATVIMALKTRKVKVRGLDDYREIILATYLSCLLLIIILTFTYTIDDRINVFAFTISLSLFIGATAILALVFVPKVTVVLRVACAMTWTVESFCLVDVCFVQGPRGKAGVLQVCTLCH